MKFLIVKPSSLGDIFHAFPAVSLLAEAFPGSEIDWVVNPAFAEALDYLPAVKRKILFQRKLLGRLSTFPKAFSDLWRDLRRTRYDAVIDLQGLMRSAVIGRLAKAKNYYGPESVKEEPAKFFYTKKMSCPATVLHALERNREMISLVAGHPLPHSDYELPQVEKFVSSAKELLENESGGAIEPGKTTLIACAPGARWKTKEWGIDFFADTLSRVLETEQDACVLLLGAASEKGLGHALRQMTGEKKNILDLTGKTSIGALTEILRFSGVLLCNDSGPMHMAAAVHTPVVALFGPTFPELTGPYCKAKSILQPDLECIKCFKKECAAMKCHTAISPEKAAESVIRHLTGGKR